MYPSLEEDWHVTTENFDSGKHGKDYELSLAKFLFKRLVDANFSNFKFTREKGGLGKFDDLIYIYEAEKQKKFCLIQLKHILDSTKKIGYEALVTNKDSYFLLSKYFNYYIYSIDYLVKDKDLFGAELEALLICTNIGFKQNLGCIKKHRIDTNLFRGSGSHYRLSMDDAAKKLIFSENYLTERQRLAKELVYYIMLNKQIDINCLKKDDHVSMLKIYHVALAKYVLDVPMKNLKREFLKGLINDENVLRFRECFLGSFIEFCTNYRALNVEELSKVLGIRLKNASRLERLLSEYNEASSIETLLNAQRILIKPTFGDESIYPNDVVSLPSNASTINNIDQKIDKFLNLLIFATEVDDNENLIRKEMSSELFIAFSDKMNQWYHEGSFEQSSNLSIRKRRWLTKETLLSEVMESSILFQGEKIPWRKLIQRTNLVHCPEAILSGFCSIVPLIGRPPPELGDTKNYYVPRLFTSSREVHQNALEKCTNNFFIISATNYAILKTKFKMTFPQVTENISNCDINVSRILLVSKHFSEQDFQKFVKSHCLNGKSIHWIKYHQPSLIWQNTFGTLKELRRYLLNSNSAVGAFREQDLMEEHLVLVSGEPGMGKSTLLNSVSENLNLNKSLDRPNWIIKVDLKDCYKILKDIPDVENFENAVRFLAYFEKAEDDLSRTVLEEFVKGDKLVILLLDGFDELQSEEEQDKIVKLVIFLRRNLNLKQIWLTTRPHLVEKLENCLGIVSFSMKEITEEEQACFLEKFLKSKSYKRNEKFFLHKAVKEFNSTLQGQCKSFLGTPLHTYMFAVVFLHRVTKENAEIPEYIKITYLFESFLQTKYEIYFQKNGENGLFSDKRQKLLTNLLDDAHKDFAIRYGGLLSPKEAEHFTLRNYSFDDDDLLDIGIVYKTKNQFYFSNQSFAEYLVAKRLVEVCLKDASARTLLKDILYNTKNSFLVYLFDLKLTEKFPLHCAVLNGDLDTIEKFSKDEINAEDCLGRRVLYYALQYTNTFAIDLLIDKGALVNGKDRFSARALFRRMPFIQ